MGCSSGKNKDADAASEGGSSSGSGPDTSSAEITPEMKDILREKWALFLETKNERDQTYGYMIFARMFALHPESLEIFDSIDNPSEEALMENTSLDRYVGQVLEGVSTVIQNLDQLDVAAEMLKSLGERHIAYGATTEFLAGFAEGCTYALETSLKDNFTEDFQKAWELLWTQVIYHNITEGLTGGEDGTAEGDAV